MTTTTKQTSKEPRVSTKLGNTRLGKSARGGDKVAAAIIESYARILNATKNEK